MHISPPHRAGVRNCQLRRLERNETKIVRPRGLAFAPRAERRSGGGAIGGIAAQPFPCKKRAVCVEQRRIGRRVAPVLS